jgi:hypothetical protein
LFAALLTTLLATLLARLSALLSALLTLAAASFLFPTLTARSLLTATLIFATIVCHDVFSSLNRLVLDPNFRPSEIESRHPFEPGCIQSKQIAAL